MLSHEEVPAAVAEIILLGHYVMRTAFPPLLAILACAVFASCSLGDLGVNVIITDGKIEDAYGGDQDA